MRNYAGWLERNDRRGSILTTTFFLCMLAALSSLWLIGTLMDHQRTNQRRRDTTRAYFAAEGGIAQIIEWGNNTPGRTLDAGGTSGMFYRDPSTLDFPNLLSSNGTSYQAPTNKLGVFQSTHGYNAGRVDSITLYPPDAGADPMTCLFKALAVGTTPLGTKHRVMAYLNPNPIIENQIILPAGLISMGTAGQNGNGTVHWGESWSKDNFDILNKSQCNHLKVGHADYDQWAKIRTERRILFEDNNTWKVGNGKDVYDITSATPNYDPGAAGSPGASGDYEGAFEINIPPGQLEWPDFLSSYQFFKDQARLHGRYYTTDAAGSIYRDGNLINFDTEFEVVDRSTEPYDLVFIDTINGQPPVANGSNLATVQVSGNSNGLKGVFYVCAHWNQTGSGNPAGILNAETPLILDDRGDADPMNDLHATQSLDKVWLDGVLYSAGVMNMGGNPKVYGTVIAEKGYASGGTPDVYYNWRLRNGLDYNPGNIGFVFRVDLQKNY